MDTHIVYHSKFDAASDEFWYDIVSNYPEEFLFGCGAVIVLVVLIWIVSQGFKNKF